VSKTIENFLEQVLVIMVIYRCEPEKSTTWTSLVQEAVRQKATIDLFVYDNSPEPQHFPTSPFIKMLYRHNSLNPGVSEAYNEGCVVARGKMKKWLLLLDQDTSFEAGWIETYFQNTVGQPQSLINVPILSSESVIISPFRYWLTKGVPSRKIEPGVYSLHRYFAINSGLLIVREVFELVGGYDESIPMDFSDFAFMSKLKRNKYRLTVIDLHAHQQLAPRTSPEEKPARQNFKQNYHGSKRLTDNTRH